jgi:Sigma-70 region 2
MNATSQQNVMAPSASVANAGPFSRYPVSNNVIVASYSWSRRPERCMNAIDTQSAGTDLRRSAWMAAAQAGDGAAYQALLRDCIPVIQSIARRRGVAAYHVDDGVQDVLLTVHRSRQTYDPGRSFTAWLCVIADRRAIDLLRRIRRQDLREVHAPLALEGHVDHAADPGRS